MAYSDTLATGGPCAGEPSKSVVFRTLLVKAIILNNTLKIQTGLGDIRLMRPFSIGPNQRADPSLPIVLNSLDPL